MGESLINKNKIRQQHPLYGQARIHVHHEPPSFEQPEEQETIPLTVPEHAMRHLELAIEADTPKSRNGNYGAVRLLVKSMLASEYVKFNEMLLPRKK